MAHNLPRRQLHRHRAFFTWWNQRGGAGVDDDNQKKTTALEQQQDDDDEDFGPLQATDLSKRKKYSRTLWNQHPVSVSSICGYRSYMEDDFVVTHNVCGVFDGHGGPKVSAYLAQQLPTELKAAVAAITTGAATIITQQQPAQHERALRTALQQIDRAVLQKRQWSYQGSTAVVLYMTAELLVVANVGDSRAVLSHQSRAVSLTRDHKPNDPYELNRIEAMGGTVEFDGYVDPQGVPFGCYRVNGNLAMSRAIGDKSERPVVSADADICAFPLTANDDFVVLATDGLWDVMDNDEVVQYIHKYGQRDEVASYLVEEALRRGSLDNITVVIVWFRHAVVTGVVDDDDETNVR